MGFILLIIWTVAAAVFIPQVALSQSASTLSDDGLRLVTVTGRAAIQHQEALGEARDMALEDALYYAALKGGAKIDGFSSVDAQTNLNDMFVVRPASQILDYSITNEVQDETHYAVTIEAVVGDMAKSGCQNRPISHITLFRPSLHLASDLPHWMSQLPASLSQMLAVRLSEQPTLRLRDARTTWFAAATTPENPLNAYDYKQLTSGRVMMRAGDFAVETKISFRSESKTELFSKIEYALVSIESTLSGATGHSAPHVVSDEFKLQLGKHLPLRSLTVFSQETRETIKSLIVMAADVHAEKIAETLNCLPMTAQLEMTDGKLRAKLGRRQGLSRNHLAVVEGQQTPWTILRVAEANDNAVFLMPLDANRNIGELAGAEVMFLEFN